MEGEHDSPAVLLLPTHFYCYVPLLLLCLAGFFGFVVCWGNQKYVGFGVLCSIHPTYSTVDDASSLPRSAHGQEEEGAARPIVYPRGVFAPQRLSFTGKTARGRSDVELSKFGRTTAPLHRFGRLQEVVKLAVEDRRPGEAWACADIGADHGLLAICLHANGASVVASDRAADPLDVAKENVKSYLQHAEEAMVAAPSFAGALRRDRNLGVCEEDRKTDDKCVPDSLPRLECRLGDGLAVLKEGEVDTVCIAGVGVRTMIQILNGSSGSHKKVGPNAITRPQHAHESISALAELGVRRLVLQPMDARLEYVRDLRVWLRENGWRISQETIISTLGKGGRHAFVTLRADCAAKSNHRDQPCAPTAALQSEWPSGYPEQSDWLGDFLPARATDTNKMGGAGRRWAKREALTFLAYLRHQRDWLLAIERARKAKGGKSSQSTLAGGVNSVSCAVEIAIRTAGEGDVNIGGGERLVTARRWQKSAS